MFYFSSVHWDFLAEIWNTHRRLIQPSFHNNILEKFIGTFTDASQLLVDRLKEAPKELNITSFVNNCVIDILNGRFVINGQVLGDGMP